jgi:predicted DNA-binding protein (MmcQ/YjbR family)
MSWIQRLTDETMPDEALEDYLRESHRLVAAGLTKRARAELRLTP